MSDTQLGRSVGVSETVALMTRSQQNYLRAGGPYQAHLAKLESEGVIGDYVFREYPKWVRQHLGTKDVKCSSTTVDKEKIEWTETRPNVRETLVYSEEEEERVLMGGKTAIQIEQDRMGLLDLAKQRGVKYDPSWSLLRLKRELGEPTGEEVPVAFDEVAQLRDQVAKLEEALALKARIAELKTQLAEDEADSVDDVDGLRKQLQALGVRVDGRWNTTRLQQELERATAPNAA